MVRRFVGALLTLVAGAACSICCLGIESSDIVVASLGEPALFEMNPEYASFNIDSSYNRGFFHTNFSNINLRAAASSLSPFTIRFGGTGNDYLYYADCKSGADSDTFGCLNETHRKDLLGLASSAGAKFLFGVSFDMNAACAASPPSSYIWNSTSAEKLIGEMKAAGQSVWGFELGNEVNNREKGGNGNCGGTGPTSGLVPSQQANAISAFSSTLERLYPDEKSRPFLIGPDTGYYDAPHWLNETLASIGSKLHAVTHHVYPGITRRNFMDPQALNRVLNDISWYVPIIQAHAPQAEIWAGEDGPTGGGESGTCGSDDISICGLSGTIFWYADDLCLRAHHGFKQYQRQDLVGGRYSLVGTQHDDEALLSATAPVKLHADFWVNFLFKRLVGLQPVSLNATSLPETLRLYAFKGKAPSKYSPASMGPSTVSIVAINLNNQSSVQMQVAGAMYTSASCWALRPSAAGGPFETFVELNGIELADAISNGRAIEKIPAACNVTAGRTISVPSSSVSFCHLH